ncbi:MAG: LysE family translocator [Desulfobacula sp.]|nr:LysE family translocator [Desulfobacula sp.]
MFGIENYLGFVIAAIILLTRSVSQGKNAGLISVAGIMSGCVVHVLCAAFGLSMILSSSAAVFMVVQWIGALYLIYLGIKMLLGKNSTFETSPSVHEAMDLMKIYKQGVLTNVLNPKVGLFFLSFLPQFIDPNHVTGPIPFLILGSTFLVTGTIWCLFLSWTAASMTNTLRNNKIAGTLLQKISGMIFIGFGLKIGLGHN